MKTIVTWPYIMESARKQANLIKNGELAEADVEANRLRKIVFKSGFFSTLIKIKLKKPTNIKYKH